MDLLSEIVNSLNKVFGFQNKFNVIAIETLYRIDIPLTYKHAKGLTNTNLRNFSLTKTKYFLVL